MNRGELVSIVMDAMVSREETKGSGQVFRNVRCEMCGDKIRLAVTRAGGWVVCDGCMHPMPPVRSFGGTGHYGGEDMSGASSSWDNAVELCENGVE